MSFKHRKEADYALKGFLSETQNKGRLHITNQFAGELALLGNWPCSQELNGMHLVSLAFLSGSGDWKGSSIKRNTGMGNSHKIFIAGNLPRA